MISLRAVSTSSYLYSIGAGAVGAASLVYLLKRHFGGGVCRSKTLLTGKTAIITGANTGIGLETAVDLARRGARVLLACRSVERGERAAVEVRKRSGNQDVSFVHLDLSSLDSVRATAESILESEARIDILVNNAGVFTASTNNSEDGYEPSFAVNHLGHFLLTNLLLDRIKASPAGRIVNVSSQGYKYCSEIDLDSLGSSTSLSTSARYNRSKLANVLFTRSLARKLQGSNVVVTVVHPGVTRTEIAREYNPLLVSKLPPPSPSALHFHSLKRPAIHFPLHVYL